MSNDNNKSALARRHFASLLIIPALFVAFYALRALAESQREKKELEVAVPDGADALVRAAGRAVAGSSPWPQSR